MSISCGISAIACLERRSRLSETLRIAGRRRVWRILLPGLLLWPSPGTTQELDAGQLQVRVDGRRVGVERYRVWRTGSTVNAVATVERVPEETWQVRLQMDPNFLPMKYELREGQVAIVSGERFADRVRFHSVSEDGERWKEYPVRGVRSILEIGVAHHYLLLVRILRDAPGERTEILIPTLGRAVLAQLAGQAAERVSIGEQSVAATRYDIDIDGARHSAWLDADDKLLRVVEPHTGREAVRMPTDR